MTALTREVTALTLEVNAHTWEVNALIWGVIVCWNPNPGSDAHTREMLPTPGKYD